MVFGMLSLYTAIVIYLNSLVGLGAVVATTLIATVCLKTSEEKRLRADFGEEYDQ